MMNQPMMSTKANTLLSLKPIVAKSYIEDMMVFCVRDFLRGKRATFHIIAERFKGELVVVRSSSTFEDTKEGTGRGHCESVLDVDSRDVAAVCGAITKVMNSYIDGEVTEERLTEIADEQILIQKQSKDVIMSGVVFTRDIIYNRPYYMISYENDERTDLVTGGMSGKTRWIAKNVSREFLEERFLKLIQAVRELEELFPDVDALDIEFAIDKEERIIIFQVRPLLTVLDQPHIISDRELRDTKSFAKCLYLDTGHMLSDTAYWNPAKHLGMNPRPLDCSLYRELITSCAWSDGVCKLGYVHVAEDLMQKIGNKPYISMDYAFAGLTPAGLNETLRYKLFSYYKENLRNNKTGHKNLESSVVFHAFDFMTEHRLQRLAEAGFTSEEIRQIKDILFSTTTNMIRSYREICQEDMSDVATLTEFRHNVRAELPLQETNVMKLYKYIKELMDHLLKYGTTQYARQSGCAYVSRNICDSLVEAGYFSKEEIDLFRKSIPTISREYGRDYDKYIHGELSKADFDKKFGHLRVGTYDIRTDCCKNITMEQHKRVMPKEEEADEIIYLDRKRLKAAISDAGMDFDEEQLSDYIVQTMINESFYEFEYQKTLCLILEIIIRLGEMLGIAREDLSYLEIPDLLSYHSRDTYIQIIESRRDMYHANTYLVLPDTIYGVGDIDVIDVDSSKPNFITNKYVEAEAVNLDINPKADVQGKIVLMSRATPEFDWIFQKQIVGYITEYGGATSHMALHCAEYGIPAALGCGEQTYAELVMKKRITLDCANGKMYISQ